LFCYRIDAERLPITTTLAADVAPAAAAAAVEKHRCLFVLTPPAARNFNKSLSKTSTFALGLERVSRRFRAGDSRPFLLLLLLLMRMLLRRDEVVLISATPALQRTDLPTALSGVVHRRANERAIESMQSRRALLYTTPAGFPDVARHRVAHHLKNELITV